MLKSGYTDSIVPHVQLMDPQICKMQFTFRRNQEPNLSWDPSFIVELSEEYKYKSIQKVTVQKAKFALG